MNIIKILESIHDCPSVYIGKKSLRRLSTFISGYICCMNEVDGIPHPFVPGFQEFVEKYYNLNNNTRIFQHWSEIIIFFNATEEEAFDEFYKLLDQFLESSKQL